MVQIQGTGERLVEHDRADRGRFVQGDIGGGQRAGRVAVACWAGLKVTGPPVIHRLAPSAGADSGSRQAMSHPAARAPSRRRRTVAGFRWGMQFSW